jgi:serine/threonine protein kinase
VTLNSGDRLGAYEVVSKLGAGGMGEVYLATDTRLGRLVALKVLLPQVAADPDWRQRLAREAQAAARLLHPHIVTLFSFEDADGVSFLTMEYVDGEALSSRIPSNGFPLAQLLAFAIPIADAVSAAHQAGIVHRDLKPGNVMVTTSGSRVKVLDFGLAKLQGGQLVDAAAPTGTVPITGDGRIVGTIAYMSPEQAEGRPTDGRSDVFSLGVMLYEMATGRRPFAGDTSISVITSILRDTPPSVTEIKPELPVELARIVRRCLQKDPDRRYQTALDLRNALDELKQESDSGTLTAVAIGHRDPPRRARGVVVAAGGTMLAGLAVLGWLMLRAGRAGPAPVANIEVHERQVTSSPIAVPVFFAAISADGRYLAYSDVRGLHLRFIETGETRDLPIPAGLCFT